MCASSSVVLDIGGWTSRTFAPVLPVCRAKSCPVPASLSKPPGSGHPLLPFGMQHSPATRRPSATQLGVAPLQRPFPRGPALLRRRENGEELCIRILPPQLVAWLPASPLRCVLRGLRSPVRRHIIRAWTWRHLVGCTYRRAGGITFLAIRTYLPKGFLARSKTRCFQNCFPARQLARSMAATPVATRPCDVSHMPWG